MEFPFHIDNTNIPIVISHNTLPLFTTFRAEVTALRNLVQVQRTLLETSYNELLIQEYDSNRYANYAVNKATFIASSLNRSKRAIVLNRAMHTNANNETILKTDPIKVKELTNNHFHTIAGTPTKTPPIIEEMTEEWQLAYLPDDDINQLIYNNLLSLPTDDEWNAAVKALSHNKAAELSGIPYEFIQQLSPDASLYLKLLVIECFDSKEILSQ